MTESGISREEFEELPTKKPEEIPITRGFLEQIYVVATAAVHNFYAAEVQATGKVDRNCDCVVHNFGAQTILDLEAFLGEDRPQIEDQDTARKILTVLGVFPMEGSEGLFVQPEVEVN